MTTNDEIAAAKERAQKMRAECPLISDSPNYAKYLTAKKLREDREGLARIFLRPVIVFCAAVRGYREEQLRMLDAPAVYLGPGK